jgi:hypothetical protein
MSKARFQPRKSVRNLVWLSCGSLLLVLPTVSSSAQIAGLYDTFRDNFIDPSKWASASICSNAATFECVREVQDGLRLAIRTYGARHSDTGIQFDTTFLNFKNPDSITSFGSGILASKASAAACTVNPAPSHAQLLLSGSFFNTGTGSVHDDVQAFLIIEQHSSNPNALVAASFLHTAGQFFGHGSLGTVELGKPVFASLRWDQLNHRFVFGLNQIGAPAVVVSTPYSLSDTTPPAAPSKFLGIRNFVPNCLAAPTVAYMEARFNAVLVNAPVFP